MANTQYVELPQVHQIFKVAFSTFRFNPYDVKPSGAISEGAQAV